jgi:hypothetical protein
MVFHQRSSHPGTYLAHAGKLSKLSFNLPDKVGVRYMNWDLTGRYLVFSTNDVKQDYHYADPNRIEVFDSMSDIYIYDMNGRLVLNRHTHGATSVTYHMPIGVYQIRIHSEGANALLRTIVH